MVLTTQDRITLDPGAGISFDAEVSSLTPGPSPIFMPRVFDPSQIKGEKFFVPAITLAWGPRGQGKTLFLAVLGEIMLNAYKKNRVKSHHKIMANFHVKYADVCHAYFVDWLMDYPPAARFIFGMVDELDSYFPSGRATTKNSLNFSTFSKQIRKRGIELTFTCQFPQEVDRRILRQVDLFIKPYIIHHGTGQPKDMRLKVWDWNGKYTGRQWVKPWPPIEDPTHPQFTPPDWEWIVFNVDTLFDKYRSDEVVASLWADSRGEIVHSEWKPEMEADMERIRAIREGEVVDTQTGEITNLEDFLSDQRDGCQLSVILQQAQRLESNIKTTRQLAERAASLGFKVLGPQGGYRLYQERIE